MPESTTFTIDENAQHPPKFGDRVDLGLIEHPDIVEPSGLVDSRGNQHVLWTHNDRLRENALFAFNTSGKHLGTYWIDGIENVDWEGLAIGPGPEPGVDYLYIGEIENNRTPRDDIMYIYRIPEPVVDFNQSPVAITLSDVDTIIYQYPDGSHDAETLLVDPLTKDLYIVSKGGERFGDTGVYRAPYPQPTDEVITLDHVATLDDLDTIVGGDISPSGLEIVLKNYFTMYYWKRTPDQNPWEAISDDPLTVPYVAEVQGEAVGWASDGTGYYTVSEEPSALPAHLFFYPRINPSVVVINEIMRNPLLVDDNQGNWFEIYNNSSDDVDLNGWTIRDEGGDFHTITQSLELSPGAFLVLGSNADSVTNGGLAVSYQYDNFVLDNSGDEILIISSSGEVADSVSYDGGDTFPDQDRVSMALLDANMDNAFGLNWRAATRRYGEGGKGTPGAPNSGPVPSLTIKEIQFTTDPSGQSPLRGQRVTISGVVSVEPFGAGDRLFFLQDAVSMWSGIMVWGSTPVEKGDLVTFTGTVEEARGGLTIIIDPSDFQVLQKDVLGNDPITVTTAEISTGGANAEAYEGVLIRVNGIVDNNSLGFREWSIDDGTGSTRVYHSLVGGFTPVLGSQYEVTGIQYYADDNFKVLPLDDSSTIGLSQP